ncbi:MAG: deoxynucleoside kinase, partial [Tidjanibacter sp.]|nr:deoxynucleoside kinase [Tidjanibacter sp.]
TMDILREEGDVIQDRTIYEDAHIFADNLHEMGLISSRDFATYMKIFNLSTGLIRQPDVLVYLKASVPTLVSQILKRGRSYEMNIDISYLDRLNRRYNDWIENKYTGNVLTVNVDEADFIMNPDVVDDIAARIVEMTSNK